VVPVHVVVTMTISNMIFCSTVQSAHYIIKFVPAIIAKQQMTLANMPYKGILHISSRGQILPETRVELDVPA
jgi:hypothetical protein